MLKVGKVKMRSLFIDENADPAMVMVCSFCFYRRWFSSTLLTQGDNANGFFFTDSCTSILGSERDIIFPLISFDENIRCRSKLMTSRSVYCDLFRILQFGSLPLNPSNSRVDNEEFLVYRLHDLRHSATRGLLTWSVALRLNFVLNLSTINKR